MSTSRLPQPVLDHHGIHLVSLPEGHALREQACSTRLYKIAAAAAALLLAMTVC